MPFPSQGSVSSVQIVTIYNNENDNICTSHFKINCVAIIQKSQRWIIWEVA